jgi:hypothetical protein
MSGYADEMYCGKRNENRDRNLKNDKYVKVYQDNH